MQVDNLIMVCNKGFNSTRRSNGQLASKQDLPEKLNQRRVMHQHNRIAFEAQYFRKDTKEGGITLQTS